MRALVLHLPVATVLVVPVVSLADRERRTLYDSRNGEVVEAVYDTEQNITWLSNAQAAKGSDFDDGPNVEVNPEKPNDGLLSFRSAKASAESFDINGFGNWRLPTTTSQTAHVKSPTITRAAGSTALAVKWGTCTIQ